MKPIILGKLLLVFLALPVQLFAGDGNKLLYRSPQAQGSRISLKLYPTSNRFTIEYATSNFIPPMEGFDLEGKKVWEKDISNWHVWREKAVPHRDLSAFTDLAACPKPLTVENCDSWPEGYMFNIASGTVLYHSPKFARFYPEFSLDGKYMLGQFGFGYSDEGGGDYSPSTGTCLMETDTGKEIWCKEEVIRESDPMLSEVGSIIAGDKGIYDFYTGNRLFTFPQYADKQNRTFVTQKPDVAIVIRAISHDGRYFVATEGKCDRDRVNRLGKEDGCNLAFLKEATTYLGAWDKGVVKKKILTFKENMQDNNLLPFYFLLDGKLAVLGACGAAPCWRVVNMSGETVSTIVHEIASGFTYNTYWFLNMEFDLNNKMLIWPSPNRSEFSVYRFNGELVGKFTWKEPQGRDFYVTGFKMINEREYIFGVNVLMTKGPWRKGEKVLEVYRGRF